MLAWQPSSKMNIIAPRSRHLSSFIQAEDFAREHTSTESNKPAAVLLSMSAAAPQS